jgi:hypothetical protein
VRHALEDEGVLALTGRPDGFDPPAHALDLGNSGTGMRLLLGLLAGRGTPATLTGDASLSRRPMARVVEPLRAMGADIRASDGRPPLVVRARAAGGPHACPASRERAGQVVPPARGVVRARHARASPSRCARATTPSGCSRHSACRSSGRMRARAR